MNRCILAFAMLVTVGPAAALYKVVGPDGRVTYTDRPPVASSGKVVPLGRSEGPSASPLDTLPLELRTAASRFPVTLYTASQCAPCDAARSLLRQRGVPYTEKQIGTQEDLAAYERVVGGRNVPGATIGAQALLGFFQDDWQSFLDAAGYPKVSQLPPGWKVAEPTPVVPRPATPPTEAPATQPTAPAAAPAPPPPAPAPAPGGIRF